MSSFPIVSSGATRLLASVKHAYTAHYNMDGVTHSESATRFQYDGTRGRYVVRTTVVVDGCGVTMNERFIYPIMNIFNEKKREYFRRSSVITDYDADGKAVFIVHMGGKVVSADSEKGAISLVLEPPVLPEAASTSLVSALYRHILEKKNVAGVEPGPDGSYSTVQCGRQEYQCETNFKLVETGTSVFLTEDRHSSIGGWYSGECQTTIRVEWTPTIDNNEFKCTIEGTITTGPTIKDSKVMEEGKVEHIKCTIDSACDATCVRTTEGGSYML